MLFLLFTTAASNTAFSDAALPKSVKSVPALISTVPFSLTWMPAARDSLIWIPLTVTSIVHSLRLPTEPAETVIFSLPGALPKR